MQTKFYYTDNETNKTAKIYRVGEMVLPREEHTSAYPIPSGGPENMHMGPLYRLSRLCMCIWEYICIHMDIYVCKNK